MRLLLLLQLLFCTVITGNSDCDVELQLIHPRYSLARDGNRLHIVTKEPLAIISLVHKHIINPIKCNQLTKSVQKICLKN